MVWERFDGDAPRAAAGASCRTSPTRPRTCCATHGVERGDRVAVVLPPTPETAAIFFGTWKLGAILLSMSVLYGDDGIRHRARRLRAAVLVTDAANARALRRPASSEVLVARRRRCSPAPPTEFDDAPTPPPTTRRSSTTRRARPGLAKGIVHAHRYLLAHEEFVYCHDVQDGERFHGMGEWAWAAGIAPLLGPVAARRGAVRLQREGGFDPDQQLDFLSPPRGHERLHDADGDALDDGDRGRRRRRYPQKFRVVCSAGEPLNPEAIRWFREQYGVTVLDYYGLTESYPLVANFPFMEVREGSMGRPMPGWDVQILDEDEQPGRARASAARSACARARTRTTRSATGATRRPREETFGGDWFHTKDAAHAGRGRLRLVRGPRRRRDHRRRLPDRPVRGRVGLPRARGRRRGGGGRLARRAPRATSSRRSSSSPRATSPPTSWPTRSRRFVRERLSAYAYPRQVEFVDDLPKTLTGQDPPDRAARGRARTGQRWTLTSWRRCPRRRCCSTLATGSSPPTRRPRRCSASRWPAAGPTGC